MQQHGVAALDGNLKNFKLWFFFADVKNSWNIEAEKNIAFLPFAGGFADEILFRHGSCVGKM